MILVNNQLCPRAPYGVENCEGDALATVTLTSRDWLHLKPNQTIAEYHSTHFFDADGKFLKLIGGGPQDGYSDESRHSDDVELQALMEEHTAWKPAAPTPPISPATSLSPLFTSLAVLLLATLYGR